MLTQLTQVVAQMAQTQANQMMHNNNHRNEGNGRVTLKDFLGLNPRIFASPIEPLDADDWLREMERTLLTARVAPDDYVPFATFLLRGESASWWENRQAMRAPGATITWPEFKASFLSHHVPDGLMERKREEFCSLTQGHMDVLS